MLKKLYKHEFYSLLRSLLPIYAALIGFAALSRLSFLIEIENKVFSIVRGLSTTVYVFAIIAVFIVGLVIVVMRFYKNLLSHEGYLTFTLPFTATQHIVCKLICGMIVMIIDFILVICSLLILGAGTEVLSEIFEVLRQSFGVLTDYVTTGQMIAVALELAVLILISPIQSLLMFYAAISLGQQFKNKIGGAVVAYICLYAAVQILSTVIMMPVSFATAGGIDEFDSLINNSVGYLQIFLLVMILYSAVLSAAYFFISRHCLTKKLNLE